MKKLYFSKYNDIPAYLMDFGFGGFLGYGGLSPVIYWLRAEDWYEG